MYVTDDVHYFFLKQNCYMYPQAKVIRGMSSLVKGMGFRFTFMLTSLRTCMRIFSDRPIGESICDELVEKYALGKKISVKLKNNIRTVVRLVTARSTFSCDHHGQLL